MESVKIRVETRRNVYNPRGGVEMPTIDAARQVAAFHTLLKSFGFCGRNNFGCATQNYVDRRPGVPDSEFYAPSIYDTPGVPHGPNK